MSKKNCYTYICSKLINIHALLHVAFLKRVIVHKIVHKQYIKLNSNEKF